MSLDAYLDTTGVKYLQGLTFSQWRDSHHSGILRRAIC